MIPDDWTDDMTVPLPEGKAAGDVVDLVIERALSPGATDGQLEQALVEVFSLSPDDAALVRDRVFGGIVRAATGNMANRPDPIKDPFAFGSFERASQEPAIIATIYPQYAAQAERLVRKKNRYVPAAYSRPVAEAPKRSWWQFWKGS